MPTVLVAQGWRLFFYSNENREPIHLHAVKGDECKYWIDEEAFDISEAYAYNLTPRLRREVKSLIYTHFDQLCQAWHDRQGRENDN